MKYALPISVISFILVGCIDENKEEVAIKKADIYFRNVPPDSSGVHFSNNLKYTNDLNIIE